MPSEKEYLIICDESDRKGPFFSNFYGGVRIGASHLRPVTQRLQQVKRDLGLQNEVKWAKTDAKIVSRYEVMMRAFFDEIAAGRLVMRVMFTQNALVPKGLTEQHHAEGYYILYYQFLKHGFGLPHMPAHETPPRLRIYLDEIGDTKEQIAKFRGFIAGLSKNSHIRAKGLILEEQNITEVRSHDHILLQCLDVVLGAMPFRLNDKHLEKPEGQHRRGKRTVAKERLYKFVLGEIKRVSGKPNFNISMTTGLSEFPMGRWSDPYLHWCFKPSEFTYDPSKKKP